MPAISQWPVVVSFPLERSAHLPNEARGCDAGATPRRERILPSPQPCRLGSCTVRESQMCPKVSDPASPHAAASGISPMPAPSRTISVMRLKGELFGMGHLERKSISHFSYHISHISFSFVASSLERRVKDFAQLLILPNDLYQ